MIKPKRYLKRKHEQQLVTNAVATIRECWLLVGLLWGLLCFFGYGIFNLSDQLRACQKSHQ